MTNLHAKYKFVGASFLQLTISLCLMVTVFLTRNLNINNGCLLVMTNLTAKLKYCKVQALSDYQLDKLFA